MWGLWSINHTTKLYYLEKRDWILVFLYQSLIATPPPREGRYNLLCNSGLGDLHQTRASFWVLMLATALIAAEDGSTSWKRWSGPGINIINYSRTAIQVSKDLHLLWGTRTSITMVCQSAVNLLGHWAEQLGYLVGRGIVNGMVRKLSFVQEWDTSPSSWFRETMTETGRELEGEIPGKGNAKVVSGHQKYSAITSRDMDWGSTKLIAFYTGIKLELIHIDCSYAACHFMNYSISFFLSLFIFPVKMSASTNIFKGLAWHPYWVWCVAWVW